MNFDDAAFDEIAAGDKDDKKDNNKNVPPPKKKRTGPRIKNTKDKKEKKKAKAAAAAALAAAGGKRGGFGKGGKGKRFWANTNTTHVICLSLSRSVEPGSFFFHFQKCLILSNLDKFCPQVHYYYG